MADGAGSGRGDARRRRGRGGSGAEVSYSGDGNARNVAIAPHRDDPDRAVALTTATLDPPTPSAVGCSVVRATTLRAARTTDGGRTWSAPVRVGRHDIRFLPDPEGRRADPPAAFSKLEVAVAPDGSLALAWPALREDGRGGVRVARSSDGGRTWSPDAAFLARAGPLFSVGAAFDGTGRLGAFFYDWDADVRGGDALTTTGRLAVAPPGATQPARLVDLPSAFDLRRTFVDGLLYDGDMSLGVTQDVRPLPSGFAVATRSARRCPPPRPRCG